MLRKIGLICLLIIATLITVNAQAFKKGKIAINAGGTVLIIGDVTPGVNFSVDYGLVKIGKKFTLGAGLSSDVNFLPDITGPHAGIRTTLHWGTRDTRDYDVYGGLGLGLPFYEEHEFAYPVYLNEFLGIRFLVTKKVGFFAEAGFGTTNIRAGLTVILLK